MSEIQAKDCSPIRVLNPSEEKAIRFFCEYFESTNKSGIGEEDNIFSLRTTTCLDNPKPSIQTRWWAGRYIGQAYITLSNSQKYVISIRPRFGEGVLVAILEDLYHIKVVNHDAKATDSSEWFSSLLNLLRKRIWVEKCSKANRYGMPRMNVKRDQQGVTLHGALDVRRTIMPWLMKSEVCTYTYEKTLDDRICQIVYEAYHILSRESLVVEKKNKRRTSGENAKIQGLGFAMPPTVQNIINALNAQYKEIRFDLTENDYQHIRYNSIYQSWKPLVDFSWSIIRGRQLGYSSSENQTECVFVDMAEIWEAFLRKKLGEGLACDDWHVWSAEKCRDTIYKGLFYQRDIIPDIILQRGDDYIVFDAKYKRMRGIKANVKNSDVDRSDLFQIHTYIQYVQHHLGNVVLGGLLYPISRKGYNDDGTLYEYSEAEVINTNSYHSDNLFGVDGKDNNRPQIPFIVDGIYCSETDNEVTMKNSVDAMIERIRKIINKS